MTAKRHFETVSFWLECVATAIVAALGRLMSPRTIKLVEEDDGTFSVAADTGDQVTRLRIVDGRLVGRLSADLETMLKGSALQLVMRPQPFLFRPLELPRRAGEYLAGIVRAQIDRLTPWSADDAVFGWSDPTEVGADRIAVTVAATARAKIAPFVQALGELGAQSIAVFTAPQSGAAGVAASAAPIKVMDHRRSSVLEVRYIQRVLAAILLTAVTLAAAAAGANVILTGNLDARRDELARKIVERRTAIRAGDGLNSDTTAGAERTLERRKRASPSAVLVLEALSQILPDHTYVTEFRIEDDRLRLTGVTQDAPSLIRLIEQSPQFTRATFFAPTTRSPSDPGERYNIEAHIEPVFPPRS